jgi:DNA primase
MKRKTPQEKKRDSYLRDRRNTYGENDKSSRKNIARSKRRRSRVERRLARTAFPPGERRVYEDRVEDVESRLVRKRRGAWTKVPDTPLAAALERTFSYRVERRMITEKDARATVARIREITRRDV